MKFGIHNPCWSFGPDPYEAFEGVKRKAQWAETNGFAWFSVMDHLIQIPSVGAPDEPFMEGWTMLSALAAVTNKIRLATLVSAVAYRSPALLAKMAATVDIISRGRLTFGIGGGWNAQEYEQYGYVFPERPAVRLNQMEEAIRLIKAMWTEPRATFEGRYFHVEDAMLEPKPVQKPHPPIMIGGGGEQITLRAVARLGNMCNIPGAPEEVKKKLDVLRRHCDSEGRDFEEIERTSLTGMLIARDEAALEAKRERLALADPSRSRTQALTLPQAVDLVGRYREAGVQLFITNLWKNDEESLELLASDVMPHFR